MTHFTLTRPLTYTVYVRVEMEASELQSELGSSPLSLSLPQEGRVGWLVEYESPSGF